MTQSVSVSDVEIDISFIYYNHNEIIWNTLPLLDFYFKIFTTQFSNLKIVFDCCQRWENISCVLLMWNYLTRWFLQITKLLWWNKLSDCSCFYFFSTLCNVYFNVQSAAIFSDFVYFCVKRCGYVLGRLKYIMKSIDRSFNWLNRNDRLHHH